MSKLFSLFVFIALIVNFLMKNKQKLKLLNFQQIIGILLSFIVSVALATFLIYYVGNWIADQIPYEWMSSLFFFLLIVTVLIGVKLSLHQWIEKITNGMFGSE
ncbi:hypothetical protein ACFPTR_08520 [Aliibacillus thermotolerans]|uniref:Uncharacterized protein n=1 Tax=Aliibacillus thermotolerans TaxID=1834418 RepID=A0ABW0U9D1_9BACI|nr:hypothetical protein [Aliibacillus thermotolerans]MDA3129352.1 hypothetical protein [Aliibacillus thermotolerans]